MKTRRDFVVGVTGVVLTGACHVAAVATAIILPTAAQQHYQQLLCTRGRRVVHHPSVRCEEEANVLTLLILLLLHSVVSMCNSMWSGCLAVDKPKIVPNGFTV